jgi:hypothetical protein
MVSQTRWCESDNHDLNQTIWQNHLEIGCLHLFGNRVLALEQMAILDIHSVEASTENASRNTNGSV